MTGFEAIEYLSKSRWQLCKPGLERIIKLLDLLENPQNNLKFIHIAGTNGKGSVCAYTSQIFIEAGYKTGQFTSPYIFDFRERVRINNKEIGLEDLAYITSKVKKLADSFPSNNHPTEFELLTAVAFVYFAREKCDIVVCEVGMGGRLDSTNVIPKKNLEICAITQIAKDHTEYLGNSLIDIAKEKAGIIKEGSCLVLANQDSKVVENILEIAKNQHVKTYICSTETLECLSVDLTQNNIVRKFKFNDYDNLETSLLALYQPKNAVQAICIAENVKAKYNKISRNIISLGIKNTRWNGRFELVEQNPYLVIDGGHNLQGAIALKESLIDVFGNKKFIFIMGVLADKDYEYMVDQISHIAKKIYCVTPPNARALSAENLAKVCIAQNIDTQTVDIKKAINVAKCSSQKDDVICAFGSLYSISSLYKPNN